jgi:transposase InsO family protein
VDAVNLLSEVWSGSQYCAQDYHARLKQFGLQASMLRPGNCYDNAPIASFWGTLKNELVHSSAR